jgi:ornithine cyclodeaminase/alanine dehydrogenase-like protein (mu-crystallin family)
MGQKIGHTKSKFLTQTSYVPEKLNEEQKMTDRQLLYLSQTDVIKVNLDMATVINLLEVAFREKGLGNVEMPPKPGIHTQPDAFIHAMPAFIPAMQSAGIKWVSGYPENQQHGLPYISGLLILNDARTGIPYAVMDCTWITAYRTGAATALAAKYLARPESKTVGILACGVQGRTNLEALKVLFPIEYVFAYDINPRVQQQYIDEMSARMQIEIIGVHEPRQAVVDSDLVVTSGPILKHPKPTIQKDWLQPGAFGSAVDFDSYWSADALSQMDRISTDDLAQFEYYRSSGYFQSTPLPYADLGEIVTGIKPAREKPLERILAMNLGLAMDDMAVAPEIYRRARKMGIGTWLSL